MRLELKVRTRYGWYSIAVAAVDEKEMQGGVIRLGFIPTFDIKLTLITIILVSLTGLNILLKLFFSL